MTTTLLNIFTKLKPNITNERLTMPEKLYISWDEFHRHTKQLAQKIKGKGSYNKIIAVSRGGLIPAGILAYELDIRNVEVVNMSSYDGDKQRTDDEITIHTSVGDVDERTLVIDDLSDTGKTFKLLRPMFPKATLAAVYAKKQGAAFADIYVEDIPDIWVVFPWD